MSDDDLDADIARMLTVRHNRQTLGFSYYEAGSQGRPKMARDPAKIREYKRTYRNRKEAERSHHRLADIDQAATELLELLAFAHAQLDKREVA